ncbi:type II toxin-antitoxin system HicB family antitoxin [bacterium]|nr:type II toxin-antitoxin system HicB family antitoxin [bacterium]
MIAYPAHFEQDPDHPHLWGVTIPCLDGRPDGAATCGTGLDEARRMAREQVEIWLCIHSDKGQEFPKPGPLPDEPGWELVRPSLRVWIALMLKALRKARGWSQVEAARRLGITQPVYAKMEDPRKANPTLATLDRVARAFEVDLALEVA